jgi:hypothetical protein
MNVTLVAWTAMVSTVSDTPHIQLSNGVVLVTVFNLKAGAAVASQLVPDDELISFQ